VKRVYLVDDSELVRRRFVDMLSEIEDVEIVGQTGSAEQAGAEIRRLSRVGIGQTLLVEGRPGA
jgi:DNA-binding NarL/FixJ family response regulator